MVSRLWTNPPLKPDGTLDYAQLTLAEIYEDLSESLWDRIVNSGLEDLQKYLDDLPAEEGLPAAPPTVALVSFLEALLRAENSDPDFCSAKACDAIRGAVQELRIASGCA